MLVCFGLSAQVLTKQVVQRSDGSPVPFVSVVVVPIGGSGAGTLTDLQGTFSIKYQSLSDTIRIQTMGFKLFKESIQNILQLDKIYLEEESVEIEKVTIVVSKKKKKRNRKVDPAYLLHKAMVARKKANDFKGNASYSCTIYNEMEVDVNNVTDQTREAVLFRPIAFLFNDIDSTSLPKKFVPILFSEGVTEYYHEKDGNRKEIIKGSRVSGLEIPSLTKFTGNVYLNYNIYNNYMNLFQKSFVSPLAENSWLTYNFYLTDSVKSGDTTKYKLEFVPRRKNELAFKGAIWTDDKTYAIHDAHLELLKTANVNYLNHFEIDLDYEYQDSAWVLKKEEMLMDVYLSNKGYGFYIKKKSNFSKHEHPLEFEKGFFNAAEKSVVWDSIAEHGDQAILNSKPLLTDSNGNAIYIKMDSVMNTPYIKAIKNIGLMYYSGYYPLKYVELGPYYSLVSWNKIEGIRPRFGGATLPTLFPKTQLFGHVAYGTKDQQFKGQIRVTHFFNIKRRRYLRFHYFEDYDVLSASKNAFPPDNIMASLSRRTDPRFTAVKKFSVEWFHSWYDGINNYIRLNKEEYRPVGSLTYLRPDLSPVSLIELNTITFGGRLALDEKFVLYGFRRNTLKTRKPIFNYEITQGVLLENTGYEFTKVEVDVADRFYLGFLGYLNVVASAGKVWGALPYPMLLNHTGNDSYYFDKYAFNLMNPFEFVSDEQVSLLLTHHFNGMILNQVPLFKKLHWRSLIFGRGAIGRLSPVHQQEIILPAGLSALNEPYLEAGFGVENVFKLFRVDFLWRMSNIGPNTQRFGVNVAVQPRL